MNTQQHLEALLAERILIIDGAMGTMIQRYGLTEEDFRRGHFEDAKKSQKGNNDLLCLTRPDVIKEIHKTYMAAGADIIETNTFSAQKISMADYGVEEHCRAINVAAAEVAKEAVAEFEAENPGRKCFVAGAMGPTTLTLSISPDVNDPSYRVRDFDYFREAYREQVEGLLDGGVDELDHPYMAMEYVDGAPFPGRERTSRWEPIAVTTARLMRALQQVHAAGVLHRDLKPANILVTSTSGIKLLDFGLAADLRRQREPGQPLEGSTFYLAPEQLRGTALDGLPDRRDDLAAGHTALCRYHWLARRLQRPSGRMLRYGRGLCAIAVPPA